MGWYDFIKRYVWNESLTPYMTKTENLNRYQADKELYIYALFLTVLFSIVAMVFLVNYKTGGMGEQLLGGVFALAVVGGAIILWREKVIRVGWFLISAPLGSFLFIYFDGTPQEITFLEKLILLCICALWTRYAYRVVKICQHYGDFTAGKKPPLEKRAK